jgi:hypothetical protein
MVTPSKSLATGSTNDISPLLQFRWYEPVYYKVDDSHFPSDSQKKRGCWVGIAEHVGHAMTFKILTDDTRKIIYRSNIQSALDPQSHNLRLDPLNDDDSVKPIIKSRHDSTAHGEEKPMPVIDPNDLIGRTFLMPQQEDGQRFRARIVRALEDHEANLGKESDRIQFVCSVNDDQFEDIISYQELLDSLEAQEDGEGNVWKFRCITAHQGPLTQHDKDYKGSKYNVMIEWENGEITTEPLSIIAADDHVTCAIYARDNNLLELDGWKWFKGIARHEQKFKRMVNQAKLRSFRTATRYKYGYEIPRDYKHAMELDLRNGNTLWRDATALELAQIAEYNTFQDLGLKADPPSGYKKIRVHLVYDCKHDGRHKARLVADGHLTVVPVESVYSGVISLRGLRTLVFLSELNGLQTWSTDIGNAYLEAKTKEKVYIIAGSEFGELEGHTLIIDKALYGLRTSSARWHERFADCLRNMGFGYVVTGMSMSTSAFMLMILQLLQRILRRLLKCWRPSTSSSLRELDLSHFILGWISFVMRMVCYAWHQRSTLRGWWHLMSHSSAQSQVLSISLHLRRVTIPSLMTQSSWVTRRSSNTSQ